MSQGGSARRRGSTWTAYYFIYDASGRRIQKSKGGFRTKGDARSFLSTVLAGINAGTYIEPTKLRLGEYLRERWLPMMKASVKESTWDSYRRNIELHIIPDLGGIPVQSLTADRLDGFYAEKLSGGRHDRRCTGLSPKTVRHLHTILHKALRDAERKGLVVRNVAAAADPPSAPATEMKTWTAAELRTFLTAMRGHRIGAAFVLAGTTGMRRGEILGLRWADVDLPRRRLSVRQAIVSVAYHVTTSTPKTARGRRSLALDPVTVAALQQHRHRQQAERIALGHPSHDLDLVFAREDGQPIHPDHFSQLFDRTVKKVGLPRIRLHDVRHTYASLGLAAGVPTKVMSERLGHATSAFTADVYTHVIPALEEAAADQVANLIFDVGQPDQPSSG
jgi:integrase